MKCKIIFSLVFMAIIFASGCSDQKHSEEIFRVVSTSTRLASQHGVSQDDYFLSSVRLLWDKRNSHFTEDEANELKDPFEIEMLKSLKDKEYWEACYTLKSRDRLGGGVCFYIEKDQGELLFIHKGT